jgi:hypothetical protein
MKKYPLIWQGLGVTIVLLFLSTTCIPVLASEGEPDITVEDIYIDMTYNGPGPLFPDLFCRIRNIGDAPVGDLNYRVIITHMLFNRIPIKTIVNTILGVGFIPPMPPGGAYTDVLPTGSPSGDNLPLFGFIKIEVTVNPQDFHPIPESNYSNNYYTETFFEINPFILPQVQWFSLE